MESEITLVDKLIMIAGVVLLILVFCYGLWVGETDLKEGKKTNDDFGM
jgi:regulatory protein YycH of two-component signal transduction system YycFG